MTLKLHQRNFWIFDMDGTLTVAAHDFDAIRATLGLPAGNPILESLATLPESKATQLYQQLEEIELRLARRATSQKGAYALLSTLSEQGKQLGILTRNSDRNARETLAACGLAPFFQPEHVLSRESCAPKPSPEGIKKLLDHWGAAPHEAVMVGDYLFDLIAGSQAGTATVYLDPSQEFEWRDHADESIASLEDLLTFIAIV